MRLVLCDEHVAFAESLGYVLAARGDDVVAVVRHMNEVAAIVAHESIDVCVVDEPDAGDLEDLVAHCEATGDTWVVLLTAQADADVRSRAIQAGVRAVAAKEQGLRDVLRLLDKVQSGEQVAAAAPRGSPTDRPRHRTEGQRLAAFLSPRERQVLSALVRGEDTTRLARTLGMSANTARSHVQTVLTKLGTHSRLAAVRLAVHTGMVDPRTGEWLIDVARAS